MRPCVAGQRVARLRARTARGTRRCAARRPGPSGTAHLELVPDTARIGDLLRVRRVTRDALDATESRERRAVGHARRSARARSGLTVARFVAAAHFASRALTALRSGNALVLATRPAGALLIVACADAALARFGFSPLSRARAGREEVTARGPGFVDALGVSRIADAAADDAAGRRRVALANDVPTRLAVRAARHRRPVTVVALVVERRRRGAPDVQAHLLAVFALVQAVARLVAREMARFLRRRQNARRADARANAVRTIVAPRPACRRAGIGKRGRRRRTRRSRRESRTFRIRPARRHTRGPDTSPE